MMQDICRLCSKKNRSDTLDRLIGLENFLTVLDYDKTPRKIRLFMWSSNFHCPYGIECYHRHHISDMEKGAQTRLDWLLSAYIENTGHTELCEILRMLQGYQPQVYHYLEKECRRIEKRRKEEKV